MSQYYCFYSIFAIKNAALVVIIRHLFQKHKKITMKITTDNYRLLIVVYIDCSVKTCVLFLFVLVLLFSCVSFYIERYIYIHFCGNQH